MSRSAKRYLMATAVLLAMLLAGLGVTSAGAAIGSTSKGGPQAAKAAAIAADVKLAAGSSAASSTGKGLAEADWSAPAAPGELVVTMARTASASTIDAARPGATVAGATVREGTPGQRTMVLKVPDGQTAAGFAAKLALNRSVESVQPNYRYQLSWVPNDPGYRYQWGLPKIGSPSAWGVTRGTAATVVGVVDTGVRLTHPDLVGRVDRVNDYDFANNDATADDDNGHGTHVAGIIAATANNRWGTVGVAPGCRILPVKVFDYRGTTTSYKVGRGIEWAANHGADVINLSMGGSSNDSYIASRVLYAQNVKDCLVVAAAGNSNRSGVDYPAALPGVLGVSATTRSNTKASFSSYGPGVDLAAPGVDILSSSARARTGTEYMSGTSMAAPFVSGAAALLRSAKPGLRQGQVAAQLKVTTQDIGATGRDSYFAQGLVRPDKALRTPPQADNEIPGVTLPASPVVRSLNELTDYNDVYVFHLRAGEQINFALTGPSSADFDLYLYGTSTKSVGNTAATAYSARYGFPESLSFVAPSAGSYFIRVTSWDGSGTYRLTYSRGSAPPPGSADDEIPGISIGSSPRWGTLSETDVHDVYALTLEAGQTLNVTLEGDSGTDFDAYLFGPGSTRVSDAYLNRAASSSYPDEFSQVALTTGTYFIDVRRYSGSGAYTLSYDVLAPVYDNDDDIPGVSAGGSPLTGALGADDSDDVFAVYVSAGETIDVSLDAATDTDFDLYLFDSSAPSIAGDYVDSSVYSSYPDSITYTASTSGYHYIDVRHYEGDGEYSVTYSIH